jgi:hypothetical protein
MPELKQLMAKYTPSVEYTGVDDAKAVLAHFLEGEFNKLKPLKHLQREIKVVFNARPKLNQPVREAYDKLFGSKETTTEEPDTEDLDTSKKSKKRKKGKKSNKTEDTAPKKTKPFGWGALNVD